ncbi:H/ACA ribonucleoprotein complex non-core subunit NAF1 [Echinococcus granulosus]|uniref:H/ACA ribonucleoprotein complex non-core subunit NAF1 n=1 Tax=Echinococcus granulosus TaxID=6210 RepID=W6U867_ECHGR|nr:H/ACA ribonucleoprotein complex non-core subunit NAF1 [Echinococcus granulosus]EUB57428.1 H/ACA ribonucleoprotein complex non-core subunit NAF1 [Echinococcus granulosus]
MAWSIGKAAEGKYKYGGEAQEDKVLPESLVEVSLSLSELASAEFDTVNDISIPDILSVLASDGSDASSFQLVSMDQSYRNPSEFSEGDADSESSGGSSDKESTRQPVAGPPIHSPKAFDLPLEIDPKYVPRLPSVPLEHVKLGVLGKVSSIIKGCVIIESLPNLPPLDKGSALFLQNRKPLGEVYDTIGPVRSPFYVVIHENRQPPSKPPKARSERATAASTAASATARSSATALSTTEGVKGVSAQPPQELPKLNVTVNVGDEVFYVLDDPALSIKILCSELSKLRGSDASGLKDQELSPDDFSDDEKEYAYRRKLEGKRPVGGNRQGRGGSGFGRGRSNHLSRQGGFRPGAGGGSVRMPCGEAGRLAPHPDLYTSYPPSQPLMYQHPPPPSLKQGFLRPSLLGSQVVVPQQTVPQQSVQFMPQQPIPVVSWNVASIPYAYCGPRIAGWHFANPSYFPQQAVMPQGMLLSYSRQQVVQESQLTNYEGNLEGVVEPTPLPAFTTGTPPRQEDPSAL